MAESEGFEPPIALRLCLISSQVHSTGLCQLSALAIEAQSLAPSDTTRMQSCRLKSRYRAGMHYAHSPQQMIQDRAVFPKRISNLVQDECTGKGARLAMPRSSNRRNANADDCRVVGERLGFQGRSRLSQQPEPNRTGCTFYNHYD